ncbi:calcium-binding protein [Defluviimonas sp. SAOS-178_SWC]|uniref:calcium-binding protein n=1 Tax=Defluviimonas sp. SAOS-178_SWC TaxID=3121287 RepID=UPI003221FA49
MATITSYYGFDIYSIDLNWFSRNFWDYYFGNDTYYNFNGITYQDVYAVNGWDGVDDLVLGFFGSGFVVNSSGAVMGGTVTAIGEEFYSGGTIWYAHGLSISAAALYQAALTSSNADDIQIVTTALSGNDVFNLSSYADRMSGFDGNDIIHGNSGGDTLYGGNGNDKLYGDQGNDLIFGDLGNDTILGGSGNDTINGGGGAGLLNGEGGNDSLIGGLGFDTIYGGSGYDTLVGGDGNDRVYGGDGRDRALLGNGNDLYTDNAQNDINGRDTVFGGAGNDTIKGGGGNDVFNGDDGNDWIAGGIGNDTINGGNQHDTIYAGGGNDVVNGGMGRDKAWLGDGNDRYTDAVQFGFNAHDEVFGMAGDDTINGGGGDDWLNGGTDDDVLTGGLGADSFVFLAGYGQDRVTDFADNVDTLVLDDALWGGGKTVAQVIADHASVVGSDVVFDFGGHSLTVAGVTNLGVFSDDIMVV